MANLCFKCVAIVKPATQTKVAESVECDGCGSACFGAVAVPELNDMQRQRCKNAMRDFVRQSVEALNEDTPRSPGWGGGSNDT